MKRRSTTGARPTRSRSRHPGVERVWFLNGALTALAIFLYFGAVRFVPMPLSAHRVSWPLLALLFCIAEIGVVHVQFRREAHSFSLSEIVLMIGLFFGSPGGLFFAQFLGAGVALAFHRRQSPIKLVFNLSNFCVQTGIAIAVFSRFQHGAGVITPRDWMHAALATTLSSLVSILTIFLAISLSEGAAQLRHLVQALGMGLIVTLTNTSLGLIGATIISVSSLAIILLGVPAATLFVAYRAYADVRSKHESLELLHESTSIIHRSSEMESAMAALLEQARKMFRAEFAEIRLLPSGDQTEALSMSVGPGLESTPLRAAIGGKIDIHDGDAPGSGGFFISDDPSSDLLEAFPGIKIKDGMAAPLHGETRTIGSLIVLNRLGDVGTYDSEDLTLFQTFANHASVALQNGRLERSLSQLKELRDELKHQAFHDPLTGLANRVLFSERLKQALARSEGKRLPAVVLFIDLDDFKTVNDSFGHAAGDELLRRVSARIQRTLRPGDLAARLGGDEFAILLERTDRRVGREVAERILRAVGRPVLMRDVQIAVGASIGLAEGMPGQSDADDVLRDADVAMYVAKGTGRSRVVGFEKGMHEAILDRVALESDLRSAIDRKELSVSFQPILELATGRVSGAEALLRWTSEQRGAVSPVDFITIAEETGLILPIGQWVLERACVELRRWQERMEDPDLSVNVNLSVRQLKDPHIVQIVEDALATSGVDGRSLVLEITESCMLNESEATVDVLHRLRALGVRIAIDDFGTGYSSLSYLSRLPVDSIKIDRSFVEGIGGAGGPSLARAIVHIGQSLSLKVVAEGIERPEQMDELVRLGCSHGQGFAIAEPLDVDEMETFLSLRTVGLGVSARPRAHSMPA